VIAVHEQLLSSALGNRDRSSRAAFESAGYIGTTGLCRASAATTAAIAAIEVFLAAGEGCR